MHGLILRRRKFMDVSALRGATRRDHPVPDLQFHLYLNAFRDENSSFRRESKGGESLRGEAMDPRFPGAIDLLSMRTEDGIDLLPLGEFIHPDDDNADDRTVWRVVLPQPVPAGGSITLDIEFVAKLPQVFARTGYYGNFFMVAQWFPKLGVYEPAGMRRRTTPGWNCHQFHATTEFYADFGEYDVTLDVPAGFKVGATGVECERQLATQWPRAPPLRPGRCPRLCLDMLAGFHRGRRTF
jgi:hypothetical protein